MDQPTDLPGTAQASWHGFLDGVVPLRPDLYRYCRHLTRSPWDAEDLAQDTLARAFVTLAQMVAALVRAVEAPPAPGDRRIVDVPAIRNEHAR